MKKLSAFAVLAAISLSLATPVLADQFTTGEVIKVDAKQKKVTIRHEELKNLEMPAMTMVFSLADEAMLDRVAVGNTIEFVADRVKGKITIVELR